MQPRDETQFVKLIGKQLYPSDPSFAHKNNLFCLYKSIFIW